jgi:ribosomal protein S18 acetylase RimI-like enzyme
MEYRILPFSELKVDDLDDVARLHLSVLPSLLTDLGLPIIRQYYQIAKMDASVIGFWAVSSADELVGWVVGSPRPGTLNARLRQDIPWFAGQMFRLARTRPFVLWQLIRSVISASDQMEGAGAIELTYIGVARAARRIGAGRALLDAFVKAARQSGYRSIELSVEAENVEATELYTKAGFGVARAIREGRFRRLRMQLDL